MGSPDRKCRRPARGKRPTRLSRCRAPNRRAGRRRPRAHDPRREGNAVPCTVEIQLGRRSAPRDTRNVDERRTARHSCRKVVGRMGRRGMDERLLYGIPSPYLPCRDMESDPGRHLRTGGRRRGPLPQQSRVTGSRSQHLSHAAQRAQLRIHGRRSFPGLGHGRSVHSGRAAQRCSGLCETFRGERSGDGPVQRRGQNRRPDAARNPSAGFQSRRSRRWGMGRNGFLFDLQRPTLLPQPIPAA